MYCIQRNPQQASALCDRNIRASDCEATNLDVHKLLAGHVGGEQQMASMIEQNQMDLVIFLCGPYQEKKHEPDAHKIFRLCDTHIIPLATNLATAELLIKSLDRGELDWREIYK